MDLLLIDIAPDNSILEGTQTGDLLRTDPFFRFNKQVFKLNRLIYSAVRRFAFFMNVFTGGDGWTKKVQQNEYYQTTTR